MKRALITGILGQDSSFMAELLHSKGYEIHGTLSTMADASRIDWIKKLVPGIILHPSGIIYGEFKRVILEVMPDEIYNFLGESNVLDPWASVSRTFHLNGGVPQDILEVIVSTGKPIKFFQASSCLIFGKDKSGLQNEDTAPNPLHPYGAAKLYADNMVKMFREEKGVFACSGIFFNHESERRKEIFLSRKITSAIGRIKRGSKEKIKIGNTSSLRDYGYAPDYMEAAYLMMQSDTPRDYVIGTGELISINDFISACFKAAGLYEENHVEIQKDLFRKSDTGVMRADISKIKRELDWRPRHTIDEMISIMVNSDLK